MDNSFDKVIDRKGTKSVKWDYLKDFFGRDDILPMWVADMDFLSPAPVIDEIRKRAEHGVYGYTGFPDSLYAAISDWMAERHCWSIRRDWITFSPGVVPALNIAILSFTKPGDGVVIQSPVYRPFFDAIENNGRTLARCPLRLENGRYMMDFAGLEDSFKSGAKMAILCSPHNPVGRVWDRDELKRFGELCVKYNVIIVSDEIHCDIVYSGAKHVPIASISDEIREKTITCIAPSKTFNIAGLSTSAVVISNSGLFSKFTQTLNSLGISGGNVFGITGAEAAYRYGGEWLDELLGYLEGSLDFLIRYIDERIPGISVVKSQGTYLAWLDCRSLGMDRKQLVNFMLDKARVGLNDGTEYGIDGEGFMRLNFACPRSILEEGLMRIENAVKVTI